MRSVLPESYDAGKMVLCLRGPWMTAGGQSDHHATSLVLALHHEANISLLSHVMLAAMIFEVRE